MKNVYNIIAKGIVANPEAAELMLAQAIEVVPQLAEFLCGDTVAPTMEQAEEKARTQCDRENYKFVKVNSIRLNCSFRYSISYDYSYVRYGKTENDSRYNTRDKADEAYNVPITFTDSRSFEF